MTLKEKLGLLIVLQLLFMGAYDKADAGYYVSYAVYFIGGMLFIWGGDDK